MGKDWDGGPLTHKVSNMSGGDPRTGTFSQTQVTVGNTACNVNEV